MGKWDRRYRPRPRHRNYQDYQWSPPRDEPCPDPETEDWQDNIPMWEKKFCYLVGRMPWRKVLSTKNFMHCHSSILGWDDSAGKEAFDNAKRRFWEGINSLPLSSELPNPNMYIDEIDWNTYIDPELVRDSDRAYFNPNDKYYLPYDHSLRGDNGCPDDNINPWERAQVQTTAVKDKATGWNQWDNWPGGGESRQEHAQSGTAKNKATGWLQWDNQMDDGENQWGCGKATVLKQWDSVVNATGNSAGDGSPWGCHTKDSGVARDSSWGGGGYKSWGVNPHNSSGMSKNWNAGGPNSWRNEGNRWQDCGPSSRNWNQKTSEIHRPNNSNNNHRPQDYSSHHRNRGPNGRGSSWDQKRRDNSNNNNNNNWDARESGNIPRGRGQFSAGGRKREGSDHYALSHKGPRLQGSDSHSSRYWNGGNTKRVTFGEQWS